MEIQDIGLPSWTLYLPNGMILKMGSAQGVLIIPDQVPDLATEAVEAEAATDRDEIIDADDLPPGHYDR